MNLLRYPQFLVASLILLLSLGAYAQDEVLEQVQDQVQELDQDQSQERFYVESLPAIPTDSQAVNISAIGDQAIVLVGDQIYILNDSKDSWTPVESNAVATVPLALAGSDMRLFVLATPEQDAATTSVYQLTLIAGGTGGAQAEWASVAELPEVVDAASMTVLSDQLYVTDGTNLWTLKLDDDSADWEALAQYPSPLSQPSLVNLQRNLFAFGVDANDNATGLGYQFDFASNEWVAVTGPDHWPGSPLATPYGLAHVFFFTLDDQPDALSANPSVVSVMSYHAVTDRWLDFGSFEVDQADSFSVADLGNQAFILTGTEVSSFEPAQVQTNYGWLDNSVVAAYLLGMLGIGWFFTRRSSKSTNDYFRGGQRIPWWAAGMSLFATGASAISLAGMPGMGFGTDWTYFTISIAFVICLPISIFVLAPLVRRLKISTSNEYLERRFGLTSRLFASTIWIFTQVASRIAAVMFLSAIALEAITDIDITTAIIIMGVVTTLYTYLGGLEAVIWTDTVQGFVMVLTVIGCLVVAFFGVDATPSEMWNEIQNYDKVHMFDWNVTTWAQATSLIFFIHVFFLTCGGITDQNFVQRVQSTPNLKQTKLAVATQLAVAVPINLLLFSLGTILWLFYRDQPEAFSPTMVNNDAVFPFFAAQQLPAGLSGVVVAALLAATMSTISSGICSVSDLCTNDFYRRLKPNPTDRQVLMLGRILTASVGIFGTLAALLLAQIEGVKSVWDTATMVAGLISSGVAGVFFLGLISSRTHEVGALFGAVVGMLVVVYLSLYTDVIFWLYIVVGNTVTVGVGLLASLILPGTPKATEGLTLFSLPVDDVETATETAPEATTN